MYFSFFALIPCQAAMNRGMPMNLVHPACKVHAARRRLCLLENSFAKANGAGWKPPSTFPLSFSLSEQMQEEQHLPETFMLASRDSLHVQNNLPYTNACDGYMPLEHEDASLPTCCLPAAVQQGSYHKHNLIVNLRIRDTCRRRLLEEESAC